ncbi:MAG: molybdopterin-dependent oxidoreductase [Chitinophagales bacterium]
MKYYVSMVLISMAVLTKINVHAQGNEEPYLKVEGEVIQSLKLYQSDLEKMKRITVKHKGHDTIEHSYTGVPVTEILNKAGVTMGKQLRGKNMAKYLLVTAADGYKVVFSLVELDSSFNDKQVILADKMDDKPLPDSFGPFQIIAAGEKKPTRSCYHVTPFIIRSVSD